jgi:DNA polymerase I-like protein with 3'-5' exonuclease and polymerase domains
MEGRNLMTLIALDTETTGPDTWHGCRPFFVSMCDLEGNQTCYQWDVDPWTREVLYEYSDIWDLYGTISNKAHTFVFHNTKFDLRQLSIPLQMEFRHAGRRPKRVSRDVSRAHRGTGRLREGGTSTLEKANPVTGGSADDNGTSAARDLCNQPTSFAFGSDGDTIQIEDTLIASHVLNSYESHGLKDLALKYLDIPDNDEEELQEVVNACRRICRRKDFKAYISSRIRGGSNGGGVQGGKHPSLDTGEADYSDEDLPAKYDRNMERCNSPWRLANANDPHWPAIDKGQWWKFDTWLPRALRLYAPEFADELSTSEPLERYAVRDAERTILLWNLFQRELEQRSLTRVYEARRALLPVTYDMESHGITIRTDILPTEIAYYEKEIKHAERKSKALAKRILGGAQKRGVQVTSAAPSGYTNIRSGPQLQSILYEAGGCPVIARTATGGPSTSAETLETLREQTQGHTLAFIESLLRYRRASKARDYLQQYKAWGVSHDQNTERRGNRGFGNMDAHDGRGSERFDTINRESGQETRGGRRSSTRDGVFTIHSNINITGTRETRQSTSSPNFQNIGKGRDPDDVQEPSNLEGNGQTGDDQTLQSRTGNRDLVGVRGDIQHNKVYSLRSVFGPANGRERWAFDYSNIELRIWAYACGNKDLVSAFESGESVHLVIARALWGPDLSKSDDRYGFTKNGNFALIYGASATKADATYKRPGACKQIRKRFPEIANFTKGCVEQCKRNLQAARPGLHGLFTRGGYFLVVPEGEPHKAVNYYVQGTAGEIMGYAMLRCSNYLQHFGKDMHMFMQVHDDLKFDVPAGSDLRYARDLARCMSEVGDEYGIPTPVSFERITTTWDHGEEIEL